MVSLRCLPSSMYAAVLIGYKNADELTDTHFNRLILCVEDFILPPDITVYVHYSKQTF